MPRGRPALTEEIVQERIAAYRTTYGVAHTNEHGFPVFPAGRRESRQHRDWVSLYRAWSRLRARRREADREDATAVPHACPLCRSDLAGAPEDVQARVRGYLSRFP